MCFIFSCALVHGYSSAGGNNSAFLPWQESVNACNYLKFQNTVHHPLSSMRQPAGLYKNTNLIPLFLKPYTSVLPDWNLAISAQLASFMWMNLIHITICSPTTYPHMLPGSQPPTLPPKSPPIRRSYFLCLRIPLLQLTARRLPLSTSACGHCTWHWQDLHESGSTVSFTAGFTAALQAPCSGSAHKALSRTHECHHDLWLHRWASYKAKNILENHTDTDRPCYICWTLLQVNKIGFHFTVQTGHETIVGEGQGPWYDSNHFQWPDGIPILPWSIVQHPCGKAKFQMLSL